MPTDIPVKTAHRTKRRLWWGIATLLLFVFLFGGWLWRSQSDTANAKGKKAGVVQIVSAMAAQRDVAVRLTANGSVSAQQTVKTVHIKEGQFVRQGERLFTLDTRTEAANLSKAEAQLVKDRADLVNAERNLERQRELFRQKFISQALLDTAQNQVITLFITPVIYLYLDRFSGSGPLKLESDPI